MLTYVMFASIFIMICSFFLGMVTREIVYEIDKVRVEYRNKQLVRNGGSYYG